jgi:hypothetical protein
MSQIPNTTPSSLSYTNNLVFNQLLTQMNPGIVYQLSNKRSIYNYFLRLINAKFGGSNALWTDRIISASRGLDFIQARILTRTTPIAGQIRLTFDKPVDAARLNDKALYNNAYERMGRIVNAVNGVGGYIDIVPLYDFTFAGTDFPEQSLLALYGDNSVNLVSQQKERRFLNPTLDYNYTSTVREGMWVARREKISTRVTSDGSQPNVLIGPNGQWYNTFQVDMLNRLELSLDLDRKFSERGATSSADGTRTTNGGYRWSVKNRGGDYVGYNTPLTKTVWENWFGSMYDKNIASDDEAWPLFCGRGFWATVSGFYEQTITNAGILNTFAGEDVTGYTIPCFYIPGIEKKIAVIQDPVLNDPLVLGARCTIPGYEKYTIAQMTAYVMVGSSQQIVGGGSAPMFKQYHYGNSEFLIGELKGLDQGSMGGGITAEADGVIRANPMSLATLDDVTSIGVLTDTGIDGYAYGGGWIEPII